MKKLKIQIYNIGKSNDLNDKDNKLVSSLGD